MLDRTLILLSLIVFAPGASVAEEGHLSARDQRCLDMKMRLEEAERNNPRRTNQEVEKLRALATELCARGKQAQGVRAFANAVELLER